MAGRDYRLGQLELPVQFELEWTPEHAHAGLVRDAAYLLRPDTLVACVDQAGSPESFDRYFSERAITPRATPS